MAGVWCVSSLRCASVLFDSYVACQALGFVAQCVEVGVKRSVANYYAHAAAHTCGGFAKDAHVSVLLTSALKSFVFGGVLAFDG